jgi:Ca2+-binding RTX toxin-like protein
VTAAPSLTGGDGADVFTFTATGTSIATLPVVTDFTAGADLLDVGFIGAPTVTSKTLTELATDVVTAGTAEFAVSGANLIVAAKGDAGGAVTQYFQLNNITSITADNFLVHAT